MDIQSWYLKTSKLALALAIIHSKPPGRSSREYTEYLATLVTQQESKWKSKVDALEAEVLQLRQQLFLSRISSGLFKNGHDVFPRLPDKEPTSSENTLALMDDSGCVLSNEQRSESAEISQHFVENCSPLPLLPLPLERKVGTTLAHPPPSHLQFLQHLLEMKKLAESDSRKTFLTHFAKDSSIVSDSVSQLLDGLITFYRSPRLPFSSLWMEAVAILAKLASDFSLSNYVLKKFSKKLEEFEKTLLRAILGNSSINRGQDNYDVTRYENIFSLFWILEQLIQQEAQESHTLQIDHNSSEIQTFLQKHDETIFQLSDAFPLFTFYLWRLAILLNSAETETVENESFLDSQ